MQLLFFYLCYKHTLLPCACDVTSLWLGLDSKATWLGLDFKNTLLCLGSETTFPLCFQSQKTLHNCD